VVLIFPSSCAVPDKALTFESFYPPGGYPAKATLAAHIADNSFPIDGYKFPPSQCDAQMTMCSNPF
jgi:hypothetical protein